jgi:EpsI family protein
MNTRTQSWTRFFVLVLLLLATFGLLRARVREEVLPTRESLSTFPLALGDWQGRDLPISPATREVLGPGDFLSRDYFNLSQQQVVNLFIAFFPSQRQGDTIHSPKNCLPGAGWIPVQSTHIWMDGQNGRKVEVNRFLVDKGGEKALVLYWYQAHGRVTPSEYTAKYRLITDSIVMNRSDGALLRVTTLLKDDENLSDAEGRAVRIAQLAAPFLDRYIPR